MPRKMPVDPRQSIVNHNIHGPLAQRDQLQLLAKLRGTTVTELVMGVFLAVTGPLEEALKKEMQKQLEGA